MTIIEVIEKHFKEDRMIYFHSSDALRAIEGETFLRYRKNGVLELYFGGNNGEVCIGCFRFDSDGERLNNLINSIKNA